MSRLARQFSLTGLYHIVFRGINKQNIFEETEDYQKIIKTLQALKKELKFEIYTYCLMSNHVHLLLKEKNTGDISQIMKRLLTKGGQKGTYLFCQLFDRSMTICARPQCQPDSPNSKFKRCRFEQHLLYFNITL